MILFRVCNTRKIIIKLCVLCSTLIFTCHTQHQPNSSHVKEKPLNFLYIKSSVRRGKSISKWFRLNFLYVSVFIFFDARLKSKLLVNLCKFKSYVNSINIVDIYPCKICSHDDNIKKLFFSLVHRITSKLIELRSLTAFFMMLRARECRKIKKKLRFQLA